MPTRLKLFFDGGCRPNPGAMEIAVVVGGRAHVDRDAGHGSRSDAEWLALIQAFRFARDLGASDYVLLGDAADVIEQANGVRRCRGAAIGHRDAFCTLVGSAAPPRIRRIKRSQNLAGIALARLHGR